MDRYLVEYEADGQRIGLVCRTDLPREEFETTILLSLAKFGVFECEVTRLPN